MTGVIDVGGGLRGIYGAGVFDRFMENGINFDYCIGVSAGSANIASYLAGQKGRNFRFYTEYSMRKKYMSLLNFIKTGSYIDMDYVYGTLSDSDGENPLNYEHIKKSAAFLRVVACNGETGETIYFDKSALEKDDYDIFKASSSIPVVCRPYFINGIPCFDGGIADPVPVQKALDDGCDKVVLILTKPRDFLRKAEKDARPARLLARKYPRAAERLRDRYKTYNEGVALAKEYEALGKALIVAPNDCCGVKTLTKSVDNLERLYHRGYRDAGAVSEFLYG